MNKDDIVTVSVKYQNWDRAYTFLTHRTDHYTVGDRAIVHTGTYEVVEVIEVHDERQDNENFDYKFLISKLDADELQMYKNRMKSIEKEAPSADRL